MYSLFCSPGKKNKLLLHLSCMLTFSIKMKLIRNLFIMKKVASKKVLIKKIKKTQLEIQMSFTYNKSYSFNLHVIYIIGKKIFSPSKLHLNKCFYVYLLDGYLKFR